MSSLAAGRRGLEELELFLADLELFTAAELAAADLLLQLSDAGGIKAAPSSSPWSASSWCDRAEGKEEVEQALAVEHAAPSTEPLDRRASKRYRLLSDLYAATSPVTSASAANKRKRHRHGEYDGSSSSVEEKTRYGAETTS